MDDVTSGDKADGQDPERNRLSGRVKRYAKVGTDVGGVAARLAVGVKRFPLPERSGWRPTPVTSPRR